MSTHQQSTIIANLPLNLLSSPNRMVYRLFIPTLLFRAPARWVTSNQSPSNVMLLNEWRCHESDSLLLGKYLFSPSQICALSLSPDPYLAFSGLLQIDKETPTGVIQSSRANKFCLSYLCKHQFDGFRQSKGGRSDWIQTMLLIKCNWVATIT